ncbi:methyl-accepting chemotaxis protein [uncultured Cohaesibacter sp.]|uniref:methyl-accepting chemotaxis protein n=1 Tax=uncultured Cohaesibacter sp. TaxID=1002546 RepID=UPI002AA85C93|nr:methyl-accepting chemotaxis protein [uncultured Cohaesibacter sp.]
MKRNSFIRLGSIQSKIAIFSIFCIALTVVSLVVTSLFFSRDTNDYIGETATGIIDGQIKERLLNEASLQAGVIKSRLSVGIQTARNMATTFSELASATEGLPAEIRREKFNGILRHTVEQNSTINGTYSAWEPNALDGDDAAYRNRTDIGSDDTGRFLPYWTKDASGKAVVQALVEYEDTSMASYGLQKGAWYLDPRSTGKERVIGPLTYLDQGKLVSLATFAVPVMIDGKFQGITGANFNLNFVQKLVTNVDSGLFDGKGSVIIISDNGLIVAYSDDASLIGKKVAAAGTSWSQRMGSMVPGKSTAIDDGAFEAIDIFAPIDLSEDNTPWTVVISVPKAVALANVNQLQTKLTERAHSATLWMIILGIIVGVAATFVMVLAARGIAKPIVNITNSMKKLAGHDTSAEIPYQGRTDEVGDMAVAVQVFKDNMIKADELSLGAAEETKRREERAQRIATLTQRFDVDASELLAATSAASKEMESTADAVSGIANDTNQRATSVATAAEQAAANVQSVASATEELTSSIAEISRQVAQSSDIAGGAVSQAEQTDQQIQGLAAASQKIGDVVNLISAIAEQTNLLALNATIEAARAGDAGKGFAVVASEVKELASQTTKATEEISQQIGTVQLETDEAVKAIQEIGKTIGDMNAIASSIAAAVEQQSSATGEIARNVEQASRGTQEVTENIIFVSQSAGETGTAATQVTSTAGELSNKSEQLRVQVERFLAEVREA